jgi:hypothetical protein
MPTTTRRKAVQIAVDVVAAVVLPVPAPEVPDVFDALARDLMRATPGLSYAMAETA